MQKTSFLLCAALVGAAALVVASEQRREQQPRNHEHAQTNHEHARGNPEHAEPDVPKYAVAVLRPTRGHQARGVVEFRETDNGVRITGTIRGLPPGRRGFHIHEFGDLRGPDGMAAGDHFNPGGHKHGGPGGHEHHYGDLGNVVANEEGVARVDMHADWMKVHFIIGRSLVVHAEEDDLESQPSGDAGPRAGLGVIGIARPPSERQPGGQPGGQRPARQQR